MLPGLHRTTEQPPACVADEDLKCGHSESRCALSYKDFEQKENVKHAITNFVY